MRSRSGGIESRVKHVVSERKKTRAFLKKASKRMCFMRQNDSRVGHFLSPRRQSRVFYDAPAFFVFFNMIKKPRTRVFYEAPAFFVLFQYDKKAANLCVLRWSSVFRFFSI